jgi:hypothetical protein
MRRMSQVVRVRPWDEEVLQRPRPKPPNPALGEKARRRNAQAVPPAANRPAAAAVIARGTTRRRKPAEHGMFGKLEVDSTSCRLHQAAATIPVVVEGTPSAVWLNGYAGRWVVMGRTSDGVLLIKPLECTAVRQLRVQEEHAMQLGARGVRVRPAVQRYGPCEPGTSELEMMTDARQQILRIQVLAQTRDDPSAWAALANGYRIERLRRPLQAAMRGVGLPQIRYVVDAYPEGWPPGLVEWLADAEAAEAKRRSTGNRTQEAQRRDEYGTRPD